MLFGFERRSTKFYGTRIEKTINIVESQIVSIKSYDFYSNHEV